MGFLDKVTGIFGKNDNDNFNIFTSNETKLDNYVKGETKPTNLPEGEIVSFELQDGVLDVTSQEAQERFKHNLQVLIDEAKRKGKIDKFMIIREDDFFPDDWEWRVLSDITNLERVSTNLSYEIRKKYALRQSGIELDTEIMGMKVPNPNVTQEDIYEAMSKVDKNLASVLLPSRFRSTKHFTINTPLGITGNYNFVEMDRDFVVIDNIDNFLNSGYAYSVGYRDAYLDVSHESLPISDEAIVLINDEKYEKIMNDEKIASELSKRRVIRFKGDETIAIDMILTQMGALPSSVGSFYAFYDQETRQILNDSIRDLAQSNDLLFNKSHGGKLTPDSKDGGHFTSYYDDKNKDYTKALNEFYGYLKQRFPKYAELFNEYSLSISSNAQDLIDKIGIDNLLVAIEDYNKSARDRMAISLSEYKEDRKKITPEIHQDFVYTVKLIGRFYEKNKELVSPEIEEVIQRFFQGKTVEEQLEASKIVREILINKVRQSKTEAIELTGDTIQKSDNLEGERS